VKGNCLRECSGVIDAVLNPFLSYNDGLGFKNEDMADMMQLFSTPHIFRTASPGII